MGKPLYLACVACTHVVLTAGTVYGWTALRLLLKQEKVFDIYPDDAREGRFSFVAILGLSAHAFSRLPLTVFINAYGPRTTAAFGSLLLFMGAILMAVADRNNFPVLSLGYAAIGFAGPFIQLPCFQIATLTGDMKKTIISWIVICFEISQVVFVVFWLVYESCHGNVGRQTLFLVYSSVGVFTLVTAIIFWPKHSSAANFLEDTDSIEPEPIESGDQEPPFDPLENSSLVQKLASSKFIYITVFFVIHNFRHCFILTSMGPQLERNFPTNTAQKLEILFAILLPVGFLLLRFFASTGMVRYFLHRPVKALVLINLLSIFYGLLFLIKSVPSFVFIFLLFPLIRLFVICMFFSYSRYTFGIETYSSISGLVSTVAAMLEIFVQPGLLYAIYGKHPGYSFDLVNLYLSLLPIIVLVYPLLQLTKHVFFDRQRPVLNLTLHRDSPSVPPINSSASLLNKAHKDMRLAKSEITYLISETEDHKENISFPSGWTDPAYALLSSSLGPNVPGKTSLN